MTLWDKTIVNIQRGYERVAAFAAAFSDRVKTEINIVRLRMQLDDVRGRIREQEAFIGKKLLELRKDDSHPVTLDLFFHGDEIVAALDTISRLEKDIENISDELRSETGALKAVPQTKDEENAA